VISAESVSGNFFEGMGAGAALGRPIEPADDAAPGSGTVAVISDAFWQRRFDRSPTVIGKTVDVNLTPVTIIGVAQYGFTGGSRVQTPQDMFLPLSMQPLIFPQEAGSLLADPDTWWIQVMGRLKPGIVSDRGGMRGREVWVDPRKCASDLLRVVHAATGRARQHDL
jgi:MacB-like periplasmic core domain